MTPILRCSELFLPPTAKWTPPKITAITVDTAAEKRKSKKPYNQRNRKQRNDVIFFSHVQYLSRVCSGFFAPFSFLLFHERRRPALVFTLHSDVAPFAWAACLRTSQAPPPASFLPFAGRSIAHPLRKQAKSHTSAYGRALPSDMGAVRLSTARKNLAR